MRLRLLSSACVALAVSSAIAYALAFIASFKELPCSDTFASTAHISPCNYSSASIALFCSSTIPEARAVSISIARFASSSIALALAFSAASARAISFIIRLKLSLSAIRALSFSASMSLDSCSSAANALFFSVTSACVARFTSCCSSSLVA